MRPLEHSTCALYTPGHQVHFIQAKLAREEPEGYRTGTIVSVQDDGWVTVELDCQTRRFWNHDPSWVRRCIEESGGHVGLPGWGLLHAPSANGGRYCICVSDDGPTPCAPLSTADSSPTGLFEQAMTHGGFMVSGIEALRHLHEDDATNNEGGAPPARTESDDLCSARSRGGAGSLQVP